MAIAVDIHPDEYRTVLFPAKGRGGAFVTVKAREDNGEVTLFLQSVAACDALITAVCEAKRQLAAELAPAPAARPQWCTSKHEPMSGVTVYCELPAGHPRAHRAPGYNQGDPDVTWDKGANPPRHAVGDICAALLDADSTTFACNSQNGHDGPDHVAWAADGRELHRWAVDVTPEPEHNCPATAEIHTPEGVTVLHCTRATGHEGDHWAGPVNFPAADEPPMCDSELPLTHGGELKCTLNDGHYGAHSALSGKRRWLGHGADARDEDGTRIAPSGGVMFGPFSAASLA